MLSHVMARSSTPDWTHQMTAGRVTLIAIGVIFTVIATTAMGLRISVAVIRKRKVGLDDWAMFIAWLSSIGMTAASFESVRWGTGLVQSDSPPEWTTNCIKAIYVIEIFYYFSIFFVKMSLLFLYLRIATDLKNGLYKGTVVTMAIIVAQFLSTLALVGVQCRPMEKYWDRSVPGQCINITAFFYSTNIFTIVSDCVILALPVSTLWNIQRPRSQRLGILAVFLIGGLSTLASCIRLYSIRIYTTSSEPIRDAPPINTWSFIEVNLGILCASAPTLKALFMPSRRQSSDQGYYFSDSWRSGSMAMRMKAAAATHFDLSIITIKEKATVSDTDDVELCSKGEDTLVEAGCGPHDAARDTVSDFQDLRLRTDTLDGFKAYAHRNDDGISPTNISSQGIMVSKSVVVQNTQEDL